MTDEAPLREPSTRAVAIVTALVDNPRSEIALDLICECDLDALGLLAMALGTMTANMIRGVPSEVQSQVLRTLGLVAADMPETTS